MSKLIIVKEINKDINISHSALKYVSKLLLKKVNSQKIDIDTAVQYREKAGRCKYLSVNEKDRIQDTEMKENIREAW